MPARFPCLLTSQQSPPTQLMNFINLWVTLGRSAMISGSPSVRRKHRSWIRVWYPHQTSESQTKNWRLFTTCVLGLDDLRLPFIRHSLLSASATQLPPCPDCPGEYGPTVSCRTTPRYRSIEYALWSHSCMTASPGPCAPDRNESRTSSTGAAS